MAIRTPVYVVCSPLDRVGKTLTARLFTEFFIAEDRYVEAFDLNVDQPSLFDYLPGCTRSADIADTRGQMALFDRLIRDDGAPKVIDLGHGSFEPFFRIVGQVGFVEEARHLGIQVVTLFVAHPGPASVQAYARLQRWLAGMVLVPVHNEGIVRGQNREQFPISGGASLPFRIPALAPGLQRIVNTPAFSFADLRYGRQADIEEAYRYELESWMKRIFVEFRELELRLLLETLQLSLQS